MEKNGLEIPEHLSMEFFQKAIQTGFELSNVRVDRVIFSMGCAGGDNYSSLIYRTKVHFKTADGSEKSVSLIVKCIPVEGDREVFKIMNVFGKEVIMYSKILPVIERMLKSVNLSGQICPRLIYSQENPINTIVFQDLNDLHLVLGNRNHGLDEDHAKMVLRKIGQFHAASMVFARDNPELVSIFNKSMFCKEADCTVRDSIFRENIRDMADLVKLWDGFGDIARKLYQIDGSFYDRIDRCLNGGESFKVLNHGDLWVNNCMFKHVNGLPNDMLFIDFQMSYYASPAIDLHYFLNTSVQLNVLISKRYILLRTYYRALKSTLEALNYDKIPSWEEFKSDLRAKEFIGFWAFEAILPLLSMSKEASKDNSIESFNNKEDSRKKRQVMFTSDRFLSTIKYSLDRFDELSVLD
ncbi:uncharacterized protein LOC129944177 [Eupeodes corollae]|uniref:uncharacterized protein LOC129944177 n=1 Tax=Eupeodes corollae TaxID=290404 RepID=UPI0024919A3A|nr:uncharacterized protein LOC129944177 [Eupeodes corollae]